MAFSNPVVSPSSGETLVDGLLWDHHWSDGSAGNTQLAVYIAGVDGKENFDFGGENAIADTEPEEVTAFNLAIELIEAVCNIDFVTVNSQSKADIIMAAGANGPAAGAYGVAVPPGEDPGPNSDDQGAVFVNYLSYESNDMSSLLQGGYDFITFIHELGHAVGLKHPHDKGGGTFPNFPGVTGAFGDYGDFDLNQGINTTMSYNDGWAAGPGGPDAPADHPSYGWQGTFMALDIAALQYLYGANTNYRTGNDTYTLPPSNGIGAYFSCIWDAGGTDTIEVAAAGGGSTIDLRAASIEVMEGGGGFVSYGDGVLGGFTIARNAVIENVSGGSGADGITGNGVDNVLKGKGGGDTIDGRDGGDRIDGDGGKDLITGGGDADNLTGGAGRDRFIYKVLDDSNAAGMDRIVDFLQGDDRIDVKRIDAVAASAGSDQVFDLIGQAAFSGAGGELRFDINVQNNRTTIYGDVDGSGADFQVRLDGQVNLVDGDFIL